MRLWAFVHLTASAHANMLNVKFHFTDTQFLRRVAMHFLSAVPRLSLELLPRCEVKLRAHHKFRNSNITGSNSEQYVCCCTTQNGEHEQPRDHGMLDYTFIGADTQARFRR